MWTRLLFVAFVAAASAQAWRPNTDYSYKVQSRTLSALHQVGDQYTGMVMRATLNLRAHSPSKLYAKVSQPEFAEVHQALPGGWGSPIPEQSLEWQKLDLSDKPFIIKLRNGVVDRLAVDPSMPQWELNMIKGIVSQLQVDAKAENYINSRMNDLPSDDSDNKVFKAMEDTVTGKCQVLYDISPLPEYILQSHPQLVPKPLSNPEEGRTLDIVKTTNYSHCEKRPAFHHGFNGENGWEPASNEMGRFFARSSVSRVVITGRPSKHLIQSSVTTNKVILSPTISNNQKGMVVSRMNLTLLSFGNDAEQQQQQQQWERAEEQATLQVNDLVYDLSHPTTQQSRRHHTSSVMQNQNTEQDRMEGAAAKRFRRSLKPDQQQQRQHESQESFESSSFEDSSISAEDWQTPKPNMNQAPEVPFLPYFVGIKGESIQKKIDAVEKVSEVARDIAKDIQSPKSVPEKATLTKFSFLTRLVQTMSAEQLLEVTEKMYTSEESSKQEKAWKVFRDAVGQAGTPPALVAIKKWIESKKMKGQEAAEILAQLPEKALIPTEEYIHLFFEIAKSENVKSESQLNTTAILAFTNLVRNAQVDRRSAHVRYPTHSFGRMNPAQAPAVTRDYIPYLAKELREAVRAGDSVRIQTYIRALGNVAHPKILAIFEPYLEGEKQVSDFQRLHMVVALNQLVKVHPSLARAVLYRIYKTASETPDVRSAAVFLLMKTNPPASMLQRMAESTNGEYSKQVRSAVKTALEYAAVLEAPESQQLAENAQAAIYTLNTTLNGAEYTRIKLASGQVPDMDVAYRAGLSHIGSDDYLLPKAAFVHFRQILAGLKKEAQSTGYMASSTKDLVNLIAAQYQKGYSQPESKGYQGVTAQQIEGNLFMKTSFGERFFAFDNQTIERIPEALKDMLKKLTPGQTFSLQKLYKKESITLAFPTASGLPFIYSMMTPTLVSVEGKMKGEIQPEISSEWKSAQAAADVKILYSTKTEARIGFVAPFNSKVYLAGTDNDAQIYLPIRAELEINSAGEGSNIMKTSYRMKVQPQKPDEDIQVATMRSTPFTTQQSIVDFKPAQQKIIHINKPQQMSFSFGREETGMAFRVEASSEKQFSDYAQVLRRLKNLDVLTAMASLTDEKEIKNYQYTVTWDQDKSKTKAVLFTADYGTLDKKRQAHDNPYPDSKRTQSTGSGSDENVFKDNDAIPTNTAPNSNDRLQQFLHRVAETMKTSRADAIDLSAQFKGEREAVYVATVAAARSLVNDRAAALVYLRHAPVSGNKHEFAMFPSVNIPHAPLANYLKAISNKPTAFAEARLSFGENLDNAHSQILIKSKFERSTQRQQYVREQPISQLCLQQASHGNDFLPACQNATMAAGLLDQYDIAVKYARISDLVKNVTYKAYGLARQLGWEYNTEDLISAENAPRKINLQVRFAPDLKSADLSIQASQMNSEFRNVFISPVARAFTIAHPNQKPTDLFSSYILGRAYYPLCTIDKSAVNTFNNKTYSLDHDDKWHLVAEYLPKKYEQVKYDPATQIPFIKVQTRQTPAQQHEVKIFFGTQDVVEIIPRGQDNPEIKVNNQVYEVKSEPTEVTSKVDGQVFVRFYLTSTGTVQLFAPQYTFELTYDSTTFVLNIGSQFRGDIRGLCGTFDGEIESDFTTPENCIVKRPEDFIESYTVSGDGLLSQVATNMPRACIYKKYKRGDVVSDQEAGRQQYLKSTKKSQAEMSFRTKVVQEEGQLCFSLRPQPTCTGNSQPTAQHEKVTPFHCVSDSPAARHWATMAQKGANVDFSSKGSNKSLTIRVPESCQA